ncbi:hypothetical protein [Butyrivibrio sp. AE3003]|uniref:hypothetical protein n=1 Tax=Butyrivibrio sp. AE3003 TaxID=1496721 RepID=UPI00047BEA35|nr:hypothetical protein [Butyrivibrio sp. AE3003]
MFKKIGTIIVWAQIFICCIVVLCVIGVTIIYPNGNSQSKLAGFLLENVTIQTMIEDDKWREEYPFDEGWIDYYVLWVKKVEKSISNYCTLSFPKSEKINAVVSIYKDRLMHYHITSISSIGDNWNYVAKCVDNVVELKKEINMLGVPFFYVQTPLDASIQYYKDKTLEEDDLNIAERSYCFTSSLEKEGVDIINIARDYPGTISFESLSHWKASDGLDCTKIIAEKLRNDYGFDIDLQLFEEGNYYDLVSRYPKIKKKIFDNCGYDFKVPCPYSNPEISHIYAEGEPNIGTFRDIIFTPVSNWSLEGGVYHNVFTITNSLINSIHNESALAGKRVLMIGDSFNWPVGSYLSLACEDVTIIHNASFTGSIIEYIKNMKPDIVIMVYNDAEFYEMYTEDAFFLK